MTFPRFIREQSARKFDACHAGIALVGLDLNRFTTLGTRIGKAASCRDVATADVLRNYSSLPCQGKSEFEAIWNSIHPFCGDDIFFRSAPGLQKKNLCIAVMSEPMERTFKEGDGNEWAVKLRRVLPD